MLFLRPISPIHPTKYLRIEETATDRRLAGTKDARAKLTQHRGGSRRGNADARPRGCLTFESEIDPGHHPESRTQNAVNGVRPFGRGRHARPCAGHPRLDGVATRKTWMAGSSPAMTKRGCPLVDGALIARPLDHVGLQQRSQRLRDRLRPALADEGYAHLRLDQQVVAAPHLLRQSDGGALHL